jgi:hypothetical protein
VLSTFRPECHSLRDDRFRYTRYRDGSEELYDHRHDPHEWTDQAYAAVKKRLASFLPSVNSPGIETSGEDINR